jgi:hypothetical protein
MDVETFRPRVTNPKVIMVGRRYSLVHRPGSYLINDTKDPNAPAELFQVGERSQALLRYRQLEAHSTSARVHLAKGHAGTWVRRTGRSVRGTLPHRYGRGVPARRWSVGARSWVAARMAERPGRALVPIVAVVSVGVLVAIMLIAVDPFQPETAPPEFSLGVGEVAAPTIMDGSGDPPRAELQTRVDEASPPPAAPNDAGHRHEAGGGAASAASDSGSSTGSSSAGSDSSTVQSTGSGGSGDSGGSSSGGSSSGGSSDSGSVDQGGGGSSGDSGSGPGGAGPGGGSTGGGGGTGSGGGGGGGGGG